MPFGFLKRRKPDDGQGTGGGAHPGPRGGEADPTPGDPASHDASAGAAARGTTGANDGAARGVPFIALTEDWRLRGRMTITGRLTDALNKREAIAISDVSWGPPDGRSPLEPAPGLKSVDPYDLILIIAGEDSLPPLTDPEREALRVHKVPYDVTLEVPPFRIAGTVFMHSGSEPERLLDRSNEMFTPVADAVAHLGDVVVSDPEVEVILINRFYLRGVEQRDASTRKPGGGTA